MKRLEYHLDSNHKWNDLKLVSEPISPVVVLLNDGYNDGYKEEVVNWWFSGDEYSRGSAGVSSNGGVTWDMESGAEFDFLFEEWGDPVVSHRHHPTIPTEPNRGKVLSEMGSL